MTTENKWQKIETAPKDGTRILCYEKGNLIQIAYFWDRNWYYSENVDEYTMDPTHWMYLPRPPITKKEGE